MSEVAHGMANGVARFVGMATGSAVMRMAWPVTWYGDARLFAVPLLQGFSMVVASTLNDAVSIRGDSDAVDRGVETLIFGVSANGMEIDPE
ncbi:hypothetical protein ACNQVK_03255 [Mycobacterium sp. 134]|uniref:hypothetical protein n=1 Tax=Mycobacterium sp. 134 TaxID=3400425 RepID=UPI003AAB4643